MMLSTENNKALSRLTALFDEGSFVQMGSQVSEAPVVTGWGTIDGNPVYAFAQDRESKNGAMNAAHAEKITKIYDLAAKTGCPVVGIYDSLGAELDKNAETMNAYGMLLAKTNQLSGVVPQISVVLGVCGGSAAMVACSADLTIMSKDAELFLHGPFQIKAAGCCEADKAGKAETAAAAGVAHVVTESEEEALEKARFALGLLPSNNLAPAPYFDFEAPVWSGYDEKNDCGAALIEKLADNGSLLHLQKDFAKGVCVALGTLAGQSVGFVANTFKENHGKLNAAVCTKIARFVRLCDSYSIPVVTLVNSAGFAVSGEEEVAGSIRQASMLAHTYAEATTAKVSVVVGKGIGPAFMALAGKTSGADLVYAWNDAVISSVCPRTAAAILYPDVKEEEGIAEYKQNVASAVCAAKTGCVDEVIAPEATRDTLVCALDMLAGKRVSRMPKKQSNIQF
ncbi:MAG: carboxyl transferase [Oscillospiraceae bacterium]|nr:carboxyl transferase [Oscillospiraceae bacterium]